MHIEILGGKNEIGGNKVLVEHGGTRILLDFGMSFAQSAKFFSESGQPRKCAALGDFFELGLLPDIKGVYRKDYLKHMGRPDEARSIDAVFLTHAHASHAQYIHFFRLDIPIFCTEATKMFLQWQEETGQNPCSELVTACRTFAYYINTKGEKSRVSRKKDEHVYDRVYAIMEPTIKEKIGSLEIEMVPVDHSLPGACGFIVYSDEGNLVYTGDLRFHGDHSELSKSFVEKAQSVNPTWLVAGGARIDQDKGLSESGAKQEILRLIGAAAGLVFVEFPIQDLDRANTMYEAAKANNRDFVVNLELAFLMDILGNECPFNLSDVKIFVPQKGWGLINKRGVEPKLIEQDYETWERSYIFRDNCITYEELCKNPQNYVVAMSIREIGQLVDIKPREAIWIKSLCGPFCEEMVFDGERKKNWLNHFNIQEYEVHSSGYASGNEIRSMIREINPQHVIAIHTEQSEMFE